MTMMMTTIIQGGGMVWFGMVFPKVWLKSEKVNRRKPEEQSQGKLGAQPLAKPEKPRTVKQCK